jgi:ABC-type lipoprotein release transport system permease subunit
MHVFLKYDKIAPMIGLSQNQAHEIAILLDDTEHTEEVMAKLKEMYPDLDIQPWDKISPEVGYMSKVMDQYMYMIVGIILLALCFGIINTMLMVVLERVKELGMLMAVGMNKGRVFRMIMLESVFLTIVGGIIGIFLGFVVSYYFGQNGLVLPLEYADAFKDLGYSNIMYPEVDLGMVITVTIMVILTGIISAIYPAWKALRLDPAEAIRTDN